MHKGQLIGSPLRCVAIHTDTLDRVQFFVVKASTRYTHILCALHTPQTWFSQYLYSRTCTTVQFVGNCLVTRSIGGGWWGRCRPGCEESLLICLHIAVCAMYQPLGDSPLSWLGPANGGPSSHCDELTIIITWDTTSSSPKRGRGTSSCILHARNLYGCCSTVPGTNLRRGRTTATATATGENDSKTCGRYVM